MKVTLFGATGGVGRHLLKLLLDSPHQLRIVVRQASKLGELPKEVEVIETDLRDHKTVASAVRDAEAVLWPVGPKENSPEQPALFSEALESALAAMPSGARIVMISGAAVPLEGDEMPLQHRFMIRLIKGLARHAWETNVRQAQVATESDKDYVLVRPGYMPEAKASGHLRADARRLPRGKTTKADVARFMFDQLESDEWVRQAPMVGG